MANAPEQKKCNRSVLKNSVPSARLLATHLRGRASKSMPELQREPNGRLCERARRCLNTRRTCRNAAAERGQRLSEHFLASFLKPKTPWSTHTAPVAPLRSSDGGRVKSGALHGSVKEKTDAKTPPS